MKLYFAGPEGDTSKIDLPSLGVTRALVSYAAGERICERQFKRFPDMFLDSGAYGAFTRGERIDLDRYIAFCHAHKWRSYAALDVIGDARATLQNAERMEAAGLTPIVAYHYGSPYAALDELCERYDHIALGGLVPIAKRRRELREHLDSCFSVIKNHWPIKVHGFGMQSRWLIERYPFYSVDSTTWLMGHKMGKYRDATGRMIDIGTRADPATTRKNVGANIKAATMLADLASRKDLYSATRHNVQALLKEEKFITKLWTKRGIEWE